MSEPTRPDYVLLLGQIVDESSNDRWHIEISVDQEKKYITLNEPFSDRPSITAPDATTEDFRNSLEAYGHDIIRGFLVWHKLNADPGENVYLYRIACLLHCAEEFDRQVAAIDQAAVEILGEPPR